MMASGATHHYPVRSTCVATALNDFNVSYELNAFTAHPKRMPQTYSDFQGVLYP